MGGLRLRPPQAYPERYGEDVRGSVTKQARSYASLQQILGGEPGLKSHADTGMNGPVVGAEALGILHVGLAAHDVVHELAEPVHLFAQASLLSDKTLVKSLVGSVPNQTSTQTEPPGKFGSRFVQLKLTLPTFSELPIVGFRSIGSGAVMVVMLLAKTATGLLASIRVCDR